MAELMFPCSPDSVDRVRAAARAGAVAFATECRALTELVDTAAPQDKEFVPGEVACVLHLSPATAVGRLATALALTARPQLLAELEAGRLGVGHALAVLEQIEHLEAEHAGAVLDELFGPSDPADPEPDPRAGNELTPGELRAAARRAVIVRDPAAARARHERAKKTAGVRSRPGLDGMGQLVIDCTAVQMATGLAAIRGRATAMSFEDPELTAGQQQVAAFLHALGCERTHVQAVIECPVERAVDLHAAAHTPDWTVDVRMPAAVALGLSDHPGVLTGYGPIDADQARALLPAADLVRACVDSVTGEVLTVDPPVRNATWTKHTSTRTSSTPANTARDQPGPAGDCVDGDDVQCDHVEVGTLPIDDGATGPARTCRAQALRDTLITMATSGGTIPDLSSPGYVPSEALGRLVDLRDVTSVFPGDSTPARRCDRDHRLPLAAGSYRGVEPAERRPPLAPRQAHQLDHPAAPRRHHPLDRTVRPQLRPQTQTHPATTDPTRRDPAASR